VRNADLHIVWNWANIKLRPAFYTSAVYYVKSNKPTPSLSNVEGSNQPPPQRYYLDSPLDVKDSYTRARNSKIIILFAGALYKNLMEIWNDKI
jgi:hypothetical protein